MKSPLNPPFSKGGKLTPPFDKGRLGVILIGIFKKTILFSNLNKES